MAPASKASEGVGNSEGSQSSETKATSKAAEAPTDRMRWEMEVKEVLNGLTREQFVQLPFDVRLKIYQQRLVSSSSESIGENELKAYSALSLFWVSQGKIDEVIKEEMQTFFYGQNLFTVPSRSLTFFMQGIRRHLRKLRVSIDLRNPLTSNDSTRLLQLLSLENLEALEIMIRGGGLPDGSDIATQSTIFNIARAVNALIEKLGSRVKVVKFGPLDRPCSWGNACNLTAYWNIPTDQVRKNYELGTVSFQGYMQVEIAGLLKAGDSLSSLKCSHSDLISDWSLWFTICAGYLTKKIRSKSHTEEHSYLVEANNLIQRTGLTTSDRCLRQEGDAIWPSIFVERGGEIMPYDDSEGTNEQPTLKTIFQES